MESPRASPRAGTLDTAYRNNCGADSVPKPCRCFCCAVLVFLSVCQTLLMDRLDPVTLAVAFSHRPSRPAQRQDSMTNMTTRTVTTTTTTVTTTTTTYKFGVLYVLRSHSKNYGTKVVATLDTWAKDVNNSGTDSLLMVGDKASENPPILPAKGCGNDHWQQLTCKTGVALQLAHEQLGLGNFSWIFVIDDDVYLHVANVHRVLSNFDPSKIIAVGIVGCGGHLLPGGGFCGGGGYALSRPAMEKIMAQGEPAFQKDLMEPSHLAKERNGQAWDDISFSKLLRRHHIPMLQMKGLYGWRLEGAQRNKSSLNSAYIKAIHQTEPLPLTFHYVNPEQKREIHQEFQQMRSSFRPTPRRLTEKGQLEALASEYDSQLACFIANERWRRALSSDRLEAGSLPVSGTCAEASG